MLNAEMQTLNNSDDLIRVRRAFEQDVELTVSTVVYEEGMRLYKTAQVKLESKEALALAGLLESAAKRCG